MRTALVAAALVAAGTGFWTAAAQDAVLTVCPAGPPSCDFATIQAAVSAAQPGDTVEVQPGTYAEQVSWLKDGITLRSTAGPGATAIDASGVPGDRGVAVTMCGSGNTLEGFRIRGGLASDFGFGVFVCVGDGNTVAGNNVERGWEGIALVSYGVTADDNVVRGNTVTNATFYGIGECCGLEGNRFEGNLVQGNRAGFYISSTGSRAVYNVIQGNTLTGMGGDPGGIDARYNYWGSPLGAQLAGVGQLVFPGANGAFTGAETVPWCLLPDCSDMKALVALGLLPP